MMILHGASAQADARNSTDMYGSDRFQALYPTHRRRKFKRSCLSSKSQSSSPHIRSVEAISGIIGWTAQWAEALTHPLRFLHLQLKGSGTLIDLLQLSKMAIENSDDLSELHQDARSAIIIQKMNAGRLTGSSALPVLLRVDVASLISSIMVVRSLPISSSRSDSLQAIW